jgi:hypothetical protein
MRLRLHHSLIVPLTAVLGCQGADAPAPGSELTPLDRVSVPLTRFRADSFSYTHSSGLNEHGYQVITDEATWNQLWQEIHATTTPVPPIPGVDFSREMVVAAALGSRNTGGYDVLLAEASEESGRLKVQVLELSPGTTCATATVLTQPVDLATLPLRAEPVDFVATSRVRECAP